MRAYTDMPFASLGDELMEKAQVREVLMIGYDRKKYIKILLPNGTKATILKEYCYKEPPNWLNIAQYVHDQLNFSEEDLISLPEI